MTAAMRLGQRKLSWRWNRRGASRRAASRSVVQWSPVEARRPNRLPVVAGNSSHGACPHWRPTARHSSTTHGGLEHRQVLHLVDDDAVEPFEPLRQLVVE